jgi:hypothetical protein
MDLVEVRPTTMHCSTAALFFFFPNQNSHYHGTALAISSLHPTNTAFISSKALIFFPVIMSRLTRDTAFTYYQELARGKS